METSKQTSNALIREEIASAAYNLWEQAGHPAAQDMDFWLQAEQLLTPSSGMKTANSPAAAKQQTSSATTKTASASRAESDRSFVR